MSTAAPWADAIAWPEERLGEALVALAAAADLHTREVEVPRLAPPEGPRVAWLEEAVARFAAWIDVDAEPVDASFGDLGPMVRGAAPALVRLGDPQRPKLLALVRTTRRSASFLGPDGAIARVPLASLEAALVPAAAREAVTEVEAVLERAGVDASRRPRARAALLRQRFAHHRVEGLWLLRSLPSAPFLQQLRGAGVLGMLTVLIGLHLADIALFGASWWILGTSALAGHLDPAWLVAWALVLATMVPIRAAAARAEGTIALEAGILLKRRLLAGALALEPDQTRADGAGRMLGRVLESQAVEQLAIDAGGAVLFTVIDLVAAAAVLASGAMPGIELLLLLAFTAGAIALGRALLARRSTWTDARLGMTHEMIERLVGHRTRVAQEPREEWHHAEDQAVQRTYEAATRLDRVAVVLAAVLPRAWLVASIGALAYALVTGPREPVGVAVTIGGALVAFGAFRRLAQGTTAVTGVVAAWQRVRPLFDAAANVEPPPSPRVVVAREERAKSNSDSLVEAREVGFGYASRRDPVLAKVSFTIGRTDNVLLLGASGGGKSTLGALVAGLRRPTSGLLLLDGLDGGTLGATAWRKHVGSAPQFHDNHVLGSTFAFNLLMGRAWPAREKDMSEAETICRELDLGGLLDRMPAGLLQTVGETGWQLSHGERSRLFLARALLQGADLVVLDESFAALDPATLAKAVDCARRRAKALVVIAHP